MITDLIQARGEVYFTEKPHKMLLGAKGKDVVLAKNNITAPACTAYHCPVCRKVVLARFAICEGLTSLPGMQVRDSGVWKMNNKGKGSGLFLIVILIVALIVAYLAVTQMSSLGFGKKEEAQIEQQDPVRQAQDAVDAINQRQQEALEGLRVEEQ